MLAFELANRLLSIHYQDLPLDAIKSAKRCIADFAAVAIKGFAADSSRVLRKVFLDGISKEESLVFGTGKKTIAPIAALLNSAAAHAVEMDDFHREAAVHPGVVVVPAALAVGEELGKNGKELILAVTTGYEAMIRIGKACLGTPYDKGFHPTAIFGVFGAAMTAASLYKLSIEQTAIALGIAGSFTGGLLEYKSNGSWTKRLNVGLAVQFGINAARLARQGFTGPLTIFEGKFGFFRAYSTNYNLELFRVPYEKFAIQEVSLKPYASCRFTHSPVDAFLSLLKENEVKIDEILEICVDTHAMAVRATMEPAQRKYRPKTAVDAQFSIPYCLGLAAVMGRISPDYFEPDYLNREDILKVASLVRANISRQYTEVFPGKNAARVTVKTIRGEFSAEVIDAKGDPENPLTEKEFADKFKMLTESVMTPRRAENLLETLYNLEMMRSLQPLQEYLKSPLAG